MAAVTEAKIQAGFWNVLALSIQSLRPSHWLKNLLIFFPAIAQHRPLLLLQTPDGALLFLALTSAASATYLINDVRDRSHDANYPSKRTRPIANGTLSRSTALRIAVVLIGISTTLGFHISSRVGIALSGYLALGFLYTFYLKSVFLLDALVLTCFFLLRIWAGAALYSIPLTGWFIGFFSLLFLGLALSKRFIEGRILSGRSLPGRGYTVARLRSLSTFCGICLGGAVAIVLCYPLSSHAAELYRHPDFLFIAAGIIAAWSVQFWTLIRNEKFVMDPYSWIISSPLSYLVVLSVLGVTFCAA